MPELKRLFVRGRMNKDLDERLLPSGEYRDALNIQVGSSEGSNVGAIQNILGNQVRKEKKGLPSTDWALDSETANYYGLPLDAKCIGGVKDDINDKLYWFVTSSTVDCILEYEDTYKVVRPVLVDTQNILNFSVNKLITGVNILDNYLFWTDDNSEPKKLEVTKGVFSTANFTTHSTYKGRDFIESDVTVIKKSPLSAPSMALANSDRLINGVSNVNTSVTYNFTEATQLNNDSLRPAIAAGTAIYGLILNSGAAYVVGDFLKLEGVALETDTESDVYIVTLQVIARTSPVQIGVKVISSSPLLPDSDTYTYTCKLQQDSPPFEGKFPRFGYRWKYENNEFSCFSPFTEVAFLATGFDYDASKGYNKGMANTVQQITLDAFDTPPVDVKKIEVLYKETNNSTIYIVDDFDPADLTETGVWEGFKITSKLIYKVVQSNQLLRPWDNVPRLAKAQELVGNRIVYGNYLQNYTISEKIALSSSVSSEGTIDIAIPSKSVKSDRDYQIGVVFKDAYGRETPVFTSDKASVKVDKAKSSTPNKIQVQSDTPPPGGFSHYKYFVKDSSDQYYNLAADRVYKSEDGVTAWVSFPSSERNKITEESYIILKKGQGSTAPVASTDNKYKVLSIKNEAPLELTQVRALVYSATLSFVNAYGSYTEQPTWSVGKTPTPGSKTFLIGREEGAQGITDETKFALLVGRYIAFTDGTSKSEYYKIVTIDWSASAADESGRIIVDRAFGDDVNFLYNVDQTLVAPAGNFVEIYAYQAEDNKAKFQGKFFVNIEQNATLLDNLFATGPLVSTNAMTFKSYGVCGVTVNGDALTSKGDGYYNDENLFVQIWGGGHSPRRLYGYDHANGGLAADTTGGWMPTWADPTAPGGQQIPFDLVIERQVQHSINLRAWRKFGTKGTKIKFANHLGTVYTIDEVRTVAVGNNNVYERIYIAFETRLAQTVNPNFSGVPGGAGLASQINIIILGEDETSDYPSNDPGIFETEPKELADLNLYYEASDAYPIADYQTLKTLTWHNCFAFGNGVESNRVRDDFNAPFIDKGTKVSTVLEEPYEEERRYSGLIYSGLYNSTSGLNGLNQFVQAEKITKDLNPMYGSIQKLHTRDTNLVALCEDKIIRILANKDALYNADGNANVTSTNNVLGQAVPFAGEYGISKNPESFASFGFRAYFSDKKRSSVLRLSMDGLTEISGKGMNDFFYDNLKEATTVIGNYDIYSDCYNLTLNSQTVSFKEAMDGWPTRKSFIPEFGISLNSDYYTMSNGMLWAHDNQLRNTFYGGATAKSSVQFIFNDLPNKIKNFKTLSYEGDSGWISPLIQTDQQDGAVTTFLDKENIYYNYIRGLNDTWDNNGQVGTLDLKQFAAQGIGQPASFDSYTGHTTFIVTVKNDPNN